MGNHSARTDEQGEFIVEGIEPGMKVLTVDARQAGEEPGTDYGRYEHEVDLHPGVNELPRTIWLSRIDHAHAARLDAPTRQETVVTHPDIPGLELHIPASAVIRERPAVPS